MRIIFNKYIITLLFLSLFINGKAIERGIPFFKNFSAKEYNAHNRNFDVVCDDYGTVFVANFEGLVYYDGSSWRKIYTPGISRVTCLAKGSDGRIWVGGYNVFGYLTADNHGNLRMKLLMSDAKNKDNQEVDMIKASGMQVFVHTTKNKAYMVESDDKLAEFKVGASKIFSQAADSISSFLLPDGVRVSYTQTSGLRFTLPNNAITQISEKDGLISNEINRVAYNGRNSIWGATTKGLFCAEVATPYSRLTENEGLKGEVYSINEIGNIVYISTQNGLFSLNEGRVTKIPQISFACWDLVKDKKGRLLAPTSDGLFVVTNSGVKKLTSANTLSVCIDPQTQEFITGEVDGLYRNSEGGKRVKISSLEKVLYLTYDGNRVVAKTIFGSLWQVPSSTSSHVIQKCIRKEADVREPRVHYIDQYGRTWQTNAEGLGLKMTSKRKQDANYNYWVNPLGTEVLNVVHVCKDGNVIVGGDFGITILDAVAMRNVKISAVGRPYIRQVSIMGDSVVWGGYSPKGLKPIYDIDDLEFLSDCHNMTINFSPKNYSLVLPTQYRYRQNGGSWSQWSDDAFISFKNLQYGETTIEIQAKDIFGRVSDVSTVSWYVHFPFYLRWWAAIFYFILLVGFISLFFRWRTKRLQKEKAKLEKVVTERTSELSDALDDLKRTQADLVRMERTATAGKLTQGLIDRILNPINYINNFSKLTSGLAKDLHEDIEDEKDNMSEDNYDDCEDILDMMGQNLQKIEEHGVNTTRTLRAMEAMLNTHIGKLVNQDILPICKQAFKVTQDYHKEDIAKCGIKFTANLPDTPVNVEVDADAFNSILLSLLNNSIYAVAKKYAQNPFDAEVSLKVETANGVTITIHDNGIGIEDTIKDKVFDPFFTTKPTGEAAGVGLYLVRELVHDHGADITLSSEQGSYTDFKITFPKL